VSVLLAAVAVVQMNPPVRDAVVRVFNKDWTGFTESSVVTKKTTYDEKGVIVGTESTSQIQPAKKLWDWMQLLIIPLVLAVAAFLFNRSERMSANKLADRREREAYQIERRRTQDTTLQNYLDEMAEFLLYRNTTTGNLLRMEPEDGVKSILRARTLAALDGLVDPDGDNPDKLQSFSRRKSLDRKRSLLQFLFESGLIEKDTPIVGLQDANLREAYLREVVIRDANLEGSDLGYADLLYANFSGNKLSKANMGFAYLRGANLEGAILEGTDVNNANRELPLDQKEETFDRFEVNLKDAVLKKANLAGSDLRGSDLTGANLDGAELDPVDLKAATVENEQLASCKSLAGTVMPDGSRYEWSAVRPVFIEFLKGVILPATRQNLIKKAQEKGCSQNLIVALMRLENVDRVSAKDKLEECLTNETMVTTG